MCNPTKAAEARQADARAEYAKLLKLGGTEVTLICVAMDKLYRAQEASLIATLQTTLDKAERLVITSHIALAKAEVDHEHK